MNFKILLNFTLILETANISDNLIKKVIILLSIERKISDYEANRNKSFTSDADISLQMERIHSTILLILYS